VKGAPICAAVPGCQVQNSLSTQLTQSLVCRNIEVLFAEGLTAGAWLPAGAGRQATGGSLSPSLPLPLPLSLSLAPSLSLSLALSLSLSQILARRCETSPAWVAHHGLDRCRRPSASFCILPSASASDVFRRPSASFEATALPRSYSGHPPAKVAAYPPECSRFV